MDKVKEQRRMSLANSRVDWKRENDTFYPVRKGVTMIYDRVVDSYYELEGKKHKTEHVIYCYREEKRDLNIEFFKSGKASEWSSYYKSSFQANYKGYGIWIDKGYGDTPLRACIEDVLRGYFKDYENHTSRDPDHYIKKQIEERNIRKRLLYRNQEPDIYRPFEICIEYANCHYIIGHPTMRTFMLQKETEDRYEKIQQEEMFGKKWKDKTHKDMAKIMITHINTLHNENYGRTQF